MGTNALGLDRITALCPTRKDYPSTSESTIQDTVLPDYSIITGEITSGEKSLQGFSLCRSTSEIKKYRHWDLTLRLMSSIWSVNEQLGDLCLAYRFFFHICHLAFSVPHRQWPEQQSDKPNHSDPSVSASNRLVISQVQDTTGCSPLHVITPMLSIAMHLIQLAK